MPPRRRQWESNPTPRLLCRRSLAPWAPTRRVRVVVDVGAILTQVARPCWALGVVGPRVKGCGALAELVVSLYQSITSLDSEKP
jgi:hypothetical protein